MVMYSEHFRITYECKCDFPAWVREILDREEAARAECETCIPYDFAASRGAEDPHVVAAEAAARPYGIVGMLRVREAKIDAAFDNCSPFDFTAPPPDLAESRRVRRQLRAERHPEEVLRVRLYDTRINGIAAHELRLAEIALDEMDDGAFVRGVSLRELDRSQRAQLHPRYRQGIPRSVPDGARDTYVLDVLTTDGWERMHASCPDLAAAADAMALSAIVSPRHAVRALRGRKAVMIYDPAGRRIVAG